MTARRVPVMFSGTISKGLEISIGREDESCGIWENPFFFNICRTCSSVLWKLKSFPVFLWSAYVTLRRAAVNAPPARPWGFGSEKDWTFDTSALVCSSRHPEIIWISAGIAFFAFSIADFDMVVGIFYTLRIVRPSGTMTRMGKKVNFHEPKNEEGQDSRLSIRSRDCRLPRSWARHLSNRKSAMLSSQPIGLVRSPTFLFFDESSLAEILGTFPNKIQAAAANAFRWM